MKAYPVKHLTACHSWRRSSSKRCCHLPLILWLCFFFPPPSSPLPDSVSSSADSSKIQLLLRRVQQEKWGTLSTLPRLRFSPEECIPFWHKQFQQLKTEAVLLYYSSPHGYWDDDLYGSLISNLSCPVTHFLELFTQSGRCSYLMFLDDCSYLVAFYPSQIIEELTSRRNKKNTFEHLTPLVKNTFPFCGCAFSWSWGKRWKSTFSLSIQLQVCLMCALTCEQHYRSYSV